MRRLSSPASITHRAMIRIGGAAIFAVGILFYAVIPVLSALILPCLVSLRHAPSSLASEPQAVRFS